MVRPKVCLEWNKAATMELIDPNMLYYFSLLAGVQPQPQNPIYDISPLDSYDKSLFEISNCIDSTESMLCDPSLIVAGELEKMVSPAEGTGQSGENSPASSVMTSGSDTRRMQVNTGCRIGFRTKSAVEILDDGYKWRKYGKKTVKDSPNPRNYYRCASEDCCVKKRVERDREDSSYVITTYEGMHNHTSPGALCYIPHPQPAARASDGTKPLLCPDSWSQQAAHSAF